MASKCSQSLSASGSAATAPPEGADDPSSTSPPGDAADYDSSDDSDYVYLPKGRDYILGREDASGEEFELDALEPSAFEWRAEDNVPKRFEFSACPGVNATHLHRRSTPFQIYSHFFTPELMDHLVRETNRYVTFVFSPAGVLSVCIALRNPSLAVKVYFTVWLFPQILPPTPPFVRREDLARHVSRGAVRLLRAPAFDSPAEVAVHGERLLL